MPLATAQPKSAARKRRAFTLVELLVVVGIIAVLISIALPVLSKVRKGANKTQCMNNVRQLLMATQLYVQTFEGDLPHPNAGGAIGWLYRGAPTVSTDPVENAKRVSFGLLYPYHNSLGAYRCPVDEGPWNAAQPTTNFTSYLMNGAANGYDDTGATWAFSRRRMPDDAICFWEPLDDGPAWNDGAVNPTEGFTVRHGTKDSDGACVGTYGGGVEWMTRADFQKLATETVKNRLWCSPDKADGR